MPNKTIYVKEEDLPLFDLAVEKTGRTISPIIVDALREYIAKEQQPSLSEKLLLAASLLREIANELERERK